MSVWTTDLGQVAESNTRLKEHNLPSLSCFILLITVSFLRLTVIVEKNGRSWPSNKELTFSKKCECYRMGRDPGSCLQFCYSKVESG